MAKQMGLFDKPEENQTPIVSPDEVQRFKLQTQTTPNEPTCPRCGGKAMPSMNQAHRGEWFCASGKCNDTEESETYFRP